MLWSLSRRRKFRHKKRPHGSAAASKKGDVFSSICRRSARRRLVCLIMCVAPHTHSHLSPPSVDRSPGLSMSVSDVIHHRMCSNANLFRYTYITRTHSISSESHRSADVTGACWVDTIAAPCVGISYVRWQRSRRAAAAKKVFAFLCGSVR